ncbi:MAG: right-handed parallel beta-helix repeat-containing protein [Leptolyngbya sp. SIO1E4]|nr:right-handed parallel beta-helix repeat-containing protein [Leptolyngbya sp. SIO1E4]
MQYLPLKFLGLVIGPLLLSAAVAQAQTPEAETPEGEAPEVEVLMVQPRGSAGYNTSGGGFDGFGYLEGFVPLFQTPGSDVWYLQGQGRLDNEGDLSGTMLFGYRRYAANSNQVWGGYIGYDGRATDDNYFNQLGVGVEMLGDVEVRLNGYLPIGNSRQLADSSSTSTGGNTVTESIFTGNSLLLAMGGGTTTTVREFEAAVGGVDLEVGTRLFDWEGGDLRGYAGVYYQDPAGASGVIGGRARLAARATRNINVGLALSSDGLFGTNVSFQIGATFGGAARGKTAETSNLALLGDFVQRQSTVIIDHQTDVEVVTIGSGTGDPIVATNPTTGLPWRFVHVTGGTTGGSGTAEDPFGQVTDAIADTQTNSGGSGNDVVYVQAGTNPGLDGFTIPDNVQVLSSGLPQTLNTTQRGGVTLPQSGSGVFPIVNGVASGVTVNGIDSMVSLGNNTTLSGFDIQGGVNYGVLVQDVSNATVVNNTISTTGSEANGVFVHAESAATNNITIADNTINTTGAGAEGILVRASGADAINIAISNNTITTSGDTAQGISMGNFDFGGANSVQVCVALSGNQVPTVGDFAFGASLGNNSGDPARFQIVNQAALLTDNTFVSVNPADITTNTMSFTAVAACP